MSLTEFDAASRHRAVAAGFADAVGAVSRWDAPTPVREWVARDVVAHLVDWFTGFLAAGGISLPNDAESADDPVRAWAVHSASVQELLDGASAAEVFRHPMAGEHRLDHAVDAFYTADVFMHTWDLARSQGVTPDLDPAYATTLLDGMTPMDVMLRQSGQYGPKVEVDPDADVVSRLMAFVGRDPQWMPPTAG